MKTMQLKKKTLGQGMTEYIIIVALIAVAAIGVFSMFGKSVSSQAAGLAKEISGTSAKDAIKNAQASSTTAQTTANTKNGLGNYNARASEAANK